MCNNDCEIEKEREVVVDEKVPILVPFPTSQQSQPIQHSVAPTIISDNTNNYTAEITLNNVINTINNVSVPITVNSSNVNHIALYPAESKVVEAEQQRETYNSNCCIVIHPRECDSSGHCYTRSSYECSEICLGKMIKIEKGK